MTHSADERKAESLNSLEFSQVFNTVSNSNLLDKLTAHGVLFAG